jgi:hypothetical protein
MQEMISCPKCGNPLIREYPGGKKKLRTNILVWDKNGCTAKCMQCKSDVSIPVTLNFGKNKKIRHVVSIKNGNNRK